MKQSKWSMLRNALELAVLYLPLLALEGLCAGGTIQAVTGSIIIFAISGVLSFCALLSEQTGTAIKKWALSIPFTVAFWFLFGTTDFSVRLLNLMLPGYGRFSAGGSFAAMFLFIAFSGIQGAANLLAICLSGWVQRWPKPLLAVKKFVLPAICGVILGIVVCLELTMPTWEAIYSSVYG